MRIFYFSCDFLYTAVRAWVTFQLLGGLFPRKRDEKVEKWIQVIVTIAVAGLNTYNNTLEVQQFSNNMLIFLVVIMSIFTKYLYTCKYREVFCFTSIFWISLTLVDFYIQSILYKIFIELSITPNMLVTANGYRGMYLLFLLTAIAYAGYKVKKWIQKNKLDTEKYKKSSYVISIYLLICMIYFQRIYISIFSEQMMSHWWIFILGTSIGVLLFVMYQVKRKSEEQNTIKELKIKMLEERYKKLQDVYDEKAILLHDMKNHIQIVEEMVQENQNQEALDYMKEITNTLKKRGNHIRTENEQLDLILNVKMQEAQDVGIYMIQKCGNMNGLKLTFAELCALFGNMMDNAIEANQKIYDEQKRWIELSCVRQGNVLVVSISNPIEKMIAISEEGLLKTTKEDEKHHGIGMQSIKKVVETYGGDMEVNAEDGEFQLELYLNGF